MRTPWPQAGFPPVFSHAAWEAEAATNTGISVLPDHPGYWPAKKKRSYDAALSVCNDLCAESVLNQLYDACFAEAADPPLLVAPALSLEETQNVLAIGYARWLADELGWPYVNGIQRENFANRDFTTNGWYRLVNEPMFNGEVETGRRYVIVDDVWTMGGTIASLRGFIESKGGRVICATTLASYDGSNARISLAEGTRSGLTEACDGRLVAAVRGDLGYETFCLTEPEGRFLLRCTSIDAFREGVAGARNG